MSSSLIILRFISFVCINCSFLLPCKYYVVWVHHNLFIGSSVDGYLEYFQVWGSTNKASMNIFV